MTKKTTLEIYDFEQKKMVEETIPAEGILRFVYENDTISSEGIKYLISKNPLVSYIVGIWMKMPWTKKGIPHFIEKYGVKASDFQTKKYTCFNDFFIRKLNASARIISADPIICPCDGRHLFYQDLSKKNSFYVKGQSLSLEKLLQDKQLSTIYKEGSMIISRLAPVDYHRFHFPVDGELQSIKTINGHLFSVNPIALRQNASFITQNKRVLLSIKSKKHGNVLQILVGATNVGSINVTAKENTYYKKNDELGYFSFGGSMIITLFQKGSVEFDDKLITQTENQTETLMKTGSPILHHV